MAGCVHSQSSIGDTSPSSFCAIPTGKHFWHNLPQLTDALVAAKDEAEPNRQPQSERLFCFVCAIAAGEAKWHLPPSLTFTTNTYISSQNTAFSTLDDFRCDDTRAWQYAAIYKLSVDKLFAEMGQSQFALLDASGGSNNLSLIHI